MAAWWRSPKAGGAVRLLPALHLQQPGPSWARARSFTACDFFGQRAYMIQPAACERLIGMVGRSGVVAGARGGDRAGGRKPCSVHIVRLPWYGTCKRVKLLGAAGLIEAW